MEQKLKPSLDCELALINLLESHYHYAHTAARETDPQLKRDFEIIAQTLRTSIGSICCSLGLHFTCTCDLVGVFTIRIEGVEWPRKDEYDA